MKKTPELCVRIHALRQGTGMTVAELAARTRIPQHHLVALEACEYHRLPEGIYRKAMVQKILKALSLEPTALAEELEQHEQSIQSDVSGPKWAQRVSWRESYSGALARMAVVAVIVLLVGGYLGMHVYGLLRSPGLEIFSPQEGLVVRSPEVTIQGKTDLEANITINGIDVMATNTGEFIQTVPLREGTNMVSIVAQKKFGGSTQAVRSIFFQPGPTAAVHDVALLAP